MSEGTYQIDSSWEGNMLQVVISGTLIGKEDAMQIAQEVAAIFEEHEPTTVLIDVTTFVGRLGVFETYDFVRTHRRSCHQPKRVAVLDRPENKKHYSFHETTALNAGLQPRHFSDRSGALKWLEE